MKALLNKLKENNILLEIVNGELKVFAGSNTLPAELIAEIRKHKEELLKTLQQHEQSDTTVSIPRVAESPDYPLSSAQHSLWVMSQFEESSIAYNIPGVYTFEGDLSIQALTAAFRLLIQRHESLRTVFTRNSAGEPRQQVLHADVAERFKPKVVDLRTNQPLLHQHILSDLSLPFDLSKDLPLRAALYLVGDDRWVFTYVMHHISSDGWSMEILVKELLTLYKTGDASLLAPLPIQYKDFAVWQQQHQREHDKDYWLQQLSGELPKLQLPTDKTRPVIKTYNGANIQRLISGDAIQAFTSVCNSEGSTLFAGLLAVVTTLLYRYSNQEDLIIGCPTAGREHPDLEQQIGCYLNTLALRMQFPGEASFNEVLQHAKKVTLEAFAHQSYPFDQLINDLQVQRDISRSPIFDVLIDYHDNRERTITGENVLEGIKISNFEWSTPPVSKFDLTFIFIDTAEGLNLLLEYNTDLFEAATIERWFTHFENLLARIGEDPSLAISDIDFITEEESDLLVKEFNNIPALYEGYIPVIDLFKQQPGDNIAVNNLSYAELDALSDKLAVYLKTEYALKQDDLVGIMMERSEKVIIAILAILKAGAAYVPIDPAYPAARKEHIATDAHLKALITQTDFIFDIDYFNGPIFAIDAQLDTIPAVNINTLHLSPIPSDALAYVIYTSGSTGQPKGCAITAGNLSHYIQWADKYYFDNQPANFGLFTSISFDLSVTAIFCPLTTGGKINTYDQITEQAYLENDALKITPSHISLLPSQSKVQTFILGGEQVNAEHIRALKSLNPNVKIFNEYGPTETTVGCIVKEIIYSVENNLANPILIGTPISNTQIYILDNHLRHVPIGIPGEIFIAGAGLAKHYLNNPTLTNEKFISLNGKRLYKTGDIAKWLPTGEIQYIGRKDEQVKINGYRIELGEIENSLLNHPEISAAVVIVTKQQQLVAYYVTKESGNTPDIKSYLHQQLPAYMVPVFFIQLDKLPLTENGKINKQLLPDPIEEFEYIAPSTATEQTLVNIWQDILVKEKISITDNFFHLGGHSLTAIRVITRIQKTLHVKLELKDLFTFPILSQLAKYISESAQTDYKAILPIAPQKDYPLSSAQRRLWILSQFKESNIAYNMPGIFTLEGSLNKQALMTAFQQLIARHESLRTIFRQNEQGEPRQIIQPASDIDFNITFHDLRTNNTSRDLRTGINSHDLKIHNTSHDFTTNNPLLLQLIEQDIHTPFDLSNGPLLRTTLYQLEDQRWVFTCLTHHITSDAWSMEILIDELLQFYNGATTLPPLNIQYKDYASWQQATPQDTDKAYWLHQLSGGLPVLDLPVDHARPAQKSYHGGKISHHFSSALQQAFEQFCQKQGSTLFSGLLAVLNALLYRLTGQNDIIIGSPVAGREHPDLAGQIGFYLNTLALRSQINGNEDFTALLESTQKNTLKALSHQSFPFDQLVEELELSRDMSRSPLFDVLIDYHDDRKNKVGALTTRQFVSNLRISRFETTIAPHSKYDLTFMFVHTVDGLNLLLEYNADIFERNTIERLSQHFESFIGAIIEQPASSIDELNFISQQETNLLVNEFNNTPSLYEGYKSVIDLFKQQPGDNIAVNNLSYAELDALSDKLAVYLKNEYALKQDDLVGIMMERSEKVIIAMLAILKAGAAYVPIDPAYPAARKEYIATDAQLKALITQTDFIFDIDYFNGPVFAIDAQLDTIPTAEINLTNTINTNNKTDTINTPDSLNTLPLSPIPADSLAYVIYTSGSTGLPKGCAITAGNLSHYIQWADKYYFNNQPANFGLFTSISFDLSVTAVFCPLTTGGKINTYDQITEQAFLENDALKITPSHISLLPSQSKVQTFILGGEQVNTEHVRALKSLNQNVKIFNEYGPTETTVGCIVKDISNSNTNPDTDRDTDENIKNINSILIGNPISNTQIYILDNHLRHVPIGIPGEIFIAGAGLAKNYLNNPTLTNEKFISLNGKRLYKTGDIAKWLPTGDIQYIGRKDEQVKINGYRIELGEIENSLLNHPEISAAVVTVTKQQQLAAYYVRQINETNSVSGTTSVNETTLDLKSYLHQQLPAYMVPLFFIQLDKLPLTENGKINKQQLPDPIQNIEYVAPSNNTEQTLVNIWQDILGKEKISLTDNFFQLGGDSIKILRMLAAVRKELNLDISISDVYKFNTINELLTNIALSEHNQSAAEKEKQKEKELELKNIILAEFDTLKANMPAHIEDIYPMSDIEKGMIFESIIHQDKGMYHDQMVHQRTFPDFDIHRFRHALQLLTEKHHILRTSFNLNDYPKELQLVHKHIDVTVSYKDISTLAPNIQEQQITDYLETEIKHPFDPLTAPLWRMAAFNIGNNDIVFVFQCHHAIIDGWSDALFMTELNNLYLQLGEDNTIKPAPLKLTYKDFIIQHEIDKRNDDIRHFWKEEVADIDRLNIFNHEPDLQLQRYTLHPSQLQKLENMATKLQTTVKAVSLTAYLYLLKILNYSPEIVTGLVTNLRPNLEDSDKLLGCFLNTIPFKIAINEQEPSQTVIKAVHDKLILLKEYDRLSMLEISKLHPQPNQSGNPFFDVLFDYVDFHAYKDVNDVIVPDKAEELSLSGGMDLTNTYLDFLINRTFGNYVLTIRLSHQLKSGFTPDKLAAMFFDILDHILDNATLPLNQANYIKQHERELLLHTFNNTPALYKGYTSVIDLFKKQPAYNIAVNSLTYQQLDEQSDRLAVYLKNEYALKQDDLVGIMMERSEKVIIAILAILKAGAAYVPIDPAYPTSRKQFIASDAQLKALITQTDFIFDIDYYNGPVFAIDAQLETIPAAGIDALNTLNSSPIPADALAYVIYTSGSTGQPKGCAITAGNLSHYIQWADKYYFDNQPANFGLFTSISFDLSITAIFCTLTTGGKINTYEQITDQAFLENDCLKITPSHIHLLPAQSKVQTFILGGEQVNEEHIRILKSINPAVSIFNEYGPTETTVGCIVKDITDAENIVIGKPISYTEIFILDNNLRLCPIGVPGEIFIAGAGLARYYLNNQALTDQKFIMHDGKRLYRTGDLAKWLSNGDIQYIGRKDEQVKIRGYRIEPAEIENILRSHPDITAAVVTVTEQQQLAAYYVSTATPDVKAYLSQHLPAYMVPAHYIPLETIPLTTNGKLDKRRLPHPEDLLQIGTPYVAPTNDTEQTLADIWQEILGKEKVGIKDNFFDLGGHSLTAIRLITRIRNEFNIDINMKDVFKDPTIEVLADIINNEQWLQSSLDEGDDVYDEMKI